ncbi:hypothetical protein D3C87_1811530 [compost metagenome]
MYNSLLSTGILNNTDMKKLIFVALVALVAIGGAFASNLNSRQTAILRASPLDSRVPCNQCDVVCSLSGVYVCKCIELTEAVYAENQSTGRCQIPLYRIGL